MNITKIHEEIDAQLPEMVAIRRHLHQNPELSFEEVKTPEMIAEHLRALDIEVRTEVGGRGVVGYLRGGKPGKTIAFRADFDALPIQDEKDVSYKSTQAGKMHACGHDGHTATLLGLATVLAKHRDSLPGTIVFIHQFAEEVLPGGARAMIEDGCLEGVDYVYGSHLQSTRTSEHVFSKPGNLQAAADSFEVVIEGKGGHGAKPHETTDPLVTASHLVVALQQIVSRNVDPLQPAVVSVGAFHSGEAFNVIPAQAHIQGTVRTYDDDVRKLIMKKIEDLSHQICEGMGAKAEVKYVQGYDAVVNHEEEVNIMKTAAVKALGETHVHDVVPVMGGEDFAYYLQERPGCFFFTGAQLADDSKVFPHHHPKFDFDEAALVTAAKVFASIIAEYDQ